MKNISPLSLTTQSSCFSSRRTSGRPRVPPTREYSFFYEDLTFNHSLCSQYSTKGSYRTFVLFLESLFQKFWCILRRIRDLPSSHHTDEIQVWSRKYLEFKTLQFPWMKIYFILECMYQIYTNADQNFANLQKSIKSLEYFIKKKYI